MSLIFWQEQRPIYLSDGHLCSVLVRFYTFVSCGIDQPVSELEVVQLCGRIVARCEYLIAAHRVCFVGEYGLPGGLQEGLSVVFKRPVEVLVAELRVLEGAARRIQEGSHGRDEELEAR